MSKPQGKQPGIDLRALAGRTRAGEKKSVFDTFMTSDKNNPAKSRIPNAAGMAVYQSLGLWVGTKPSFTYQVQGKPQRFARSVEGLHDFFKMVYDEDAISLQGQSRNEGVTAALGYFLQDIESIQTAQAQRLNEGGGSARTK